MNLPKIHSITKKICVALLGAFLLIFLLFHACANMCILRHDGGAWYSAFCHFMGTNLIVKVCEVILLGAIFLHICLTVWLWFTNRQARGTERYHQPSKTTTHIGSKLMIWTGVLMIVLLAVHFCDFYFAKLGFVEGKYMAKTEEVSKNLGAIMSNPDPENADIQMAVQLASQAFQNQADPAELVANYEASIQQQMAAMNNGDTLAAQQNEMLQQQAEQIEQLKRALPLSQFFASFINANQSGAEYVSEISAETLPVLKEAMPEVEFEPNFYEMTREKFRNPLFALLYLVFFVVVWFHMRHAFASAFQTLGLNNYKYNCAIEVIAQIYAWIVCLMFAAVVILVYLGL